MAACWHELMPFGFAMADASTFFSTSSFPLFTNSSAAPTCSAPCAWPWNCLASASPDETKNSIRGASVPSTWIDFSPTSVAGTPAASMHDSATPRLSLGLGPALRIDSSSLPQPASARAARTMRARAVTARAG